MVIEWTLKPFVFLSIALQHVAGLFLRIVACPGEKRKVFSMALKDDRVEQCLRSCGSEFQTWGPKQENARKP